MTALNRSAASMCLCALLEIPSCLFSAAHAQAAGTPCSRTAAVVPNPDPCASCPAPHREDGTRDRAAWALSPSRGLQAVKDAEKLLMAVFTNMQTQAEGPEDGAQYEHHPDHRRNSFQTNPFEAGSIPGLHPGLTPSLNGYGPSNRLHSVLEAPGPHSQPRPGSPTRVSMLQGEDSWRSENGAGSGSRLWPSNTPSEAGDAALTWQPTPAPRPYTSHGEVRGHLPSTAPLFSH